MTNDSLIKKYRTAGLSNAAIAKKLGITEVEVAQRWNLIVMSEQIAVAGHGDLSNLVTVLCYQYQLLGESLKQVAQALHNTASPGEIKALLVPESDEQTVVNLLKSFVILRPFKMEDPTEALERHLKQVREGN